MRAGIVLLMCIYCGILQGAEIELAWTLMNGKRDIQKVQVEEKDGVTAFSLSKEAIIAKGAKELAVTPDFATAKSGGKEGYWIVPTGQFGTYRCAKGTFSCSWPSMAMFGMKTPAKTYVAIVKGLKYYFTARITAQGSVYRQSCVLNREQCTEPYEDFVFEGKSIPAEDWLLVEP